MTQKSYSQNITSDLLKEINYRLAEGLECKQLVEEQSHQIDLLEQSNINKAKTIEAKDKQIAAHTEITAISEGRERAMAEQVVKCTEDKAKAERDASRLKKGRNTWRLIAGIETVLLVGIVYLSIR